jgi:hypothetical protein
VLLESGLVWDACCVLNLAATNRASDILASFSRPSYVVKEVYRNEVISLRPLPEEDPTGKQVPVDLTPLFSSGLLQEIELTQIERIRFAILSEDINDGEARSAAAALERNLSLVTDDRSAINHLSLNYKNLIIYRTPDWVNRWSSFLNISEDELKDVIRRIRKCARYDAPSDHPLKKWWQSYLKEE